jgi:hypothetical protein
MTGDSDLSGHRARRRNSWRSSKRYAGGFRGSVCTRVNTGDQESSSARIWALSSAATVSE